MNERFYEFFIVTGFLFACFALFESKHYYGFTEACVSKLNAQDKTRGG